LTEALLLKPNDAAKMLGIGRSKLYSLMGAGELPVVRIGRCVRIPRVELERWVAVQLESNNAKETSSR